MENDAEVGAKGTELGTGAANTIAIVGAPGGPRLAAMLCYGLVVGIYEDWFLPSKDELNKLYLARDVIGEFSAGYYWTSTEASGDAWIQSFSTGVQSTYSKKGNFLVRAVRVF